MITTLLYRDWEFVARGQDRWLPARVPGHVHVDLYRAGVIPDPLTHLHEHGVQWVDETDWTYRCSFDWTPRVGLPRRVLRFEGLDTLATIRLNDEIIGRSENMHVPVEFDVTDRLRPGLNTLTVEFFAAARIGREAMERFVAEQALGERVANFYERSFVRKAQYMFGWDWGPRLVSCGIWRPVRLIEFAARLIDVDIRHTHRADGSVEITVAPEIEGDAKVEMSLIGPDGETVRLGKSGKTTLRDPLLWWTHDLGESHLYEIAITLAPICGEPFTETRTFGIRTIRLISEPDAHGESFEFELNGVPLYVRGANWIPNHAFPSQVTETILYEQFTRATELNMNMLRVWGGGLYESDDFYRLADEMGVLIWQDFAFACAYYPDDGSWAEMARTEAIANIRRLRHHPSLALWCGNNENSTMYHSGWGGKERNPERLYGEFLYDHVFPKVLDELDPDRPYLPSSPIGGPDPNQGGIGDQHYWKVWHGGDWRAYADSTARFSSEFGFAASCSLELWDRTLPAHDRDPRGPSVSSHNKTGKTWEQVEGLIRLHYPSIETLDDYHYYSQLNQRDALRFGIEHYRRSEFCRGTLIWQFNDCWPVFSWSIVDASGVYKAAAYELARLYAPTLVSLERTGAHVRVHLVNDHHETHRDVVEVRAISLTTGEVRETWSRDAALKPGERRRALEVSIRGLDTSDTVIVASWNGDETWQLLAEPKDSRFRKFPVHATLGFEGLTVHAEGPVLDLRLTGFPTDHPSLIGREPWVSLPAGGSRVLPFDEAPDVLMGRSLAGTFPVPVYRLG